MAWIDEHHHYRYVRGPSPDCRVAVGDWIRITWMRGEPTAEVIGIDEQGWPVIEHPETPGIGPMTVDVYDVARRRDDQVLFIGMGI